MLTLASTMTGGFSWEALKAIALAPGEPTTTEAQLLDLLEEALSKQLIAERKGEGAGTYDFTHALIRQTLYEELSTPRRVLLHRQIGESLERLYAGNVDPHLPELAHHFFMAAPGGDVQKAIDYAKRAGDRAMDVAAWEEAAGHYERSLQVLELQSGQHWAGACDLLMRLGEAQFAFSATDASMGSFRRASDLARTENDPARFAMAALGYASLPSVGLVRDDYVVLLREALQRVGQADGALRARLLARLGQELYFGDQREFRALTLEGVEVARRVGDKRALAEALFARMWGGTTFIDSAEERLADANEIIDSAEAVNDSRSVAFGLFQRIANRMVMRQVTQAYQDVETYARLADELRRDFYSWQLELFRSMRALFEGRLDDAERIATGALAIGQRGQSDAAGQMFAAQLYAIRREQGRIHELTDGIKQLVDTYPAIPAWRTALAYNYAERGMVEETRSEFEVLAKDDFAMFPRDANWPISQALLVEVCAYLRDRQRAAYLYDQLLPSAEKCVIVGACVDVYGVTHGALGRLATVLERWDDAERHFTAALEMNTAMGATRWVARIQLRYGEMLLLRDGPGDRARGLMLLSQAIDTSEPLGMKANVDDALALKLQAQGALSSSVYTSIDAVAREVERDRPQISVHPAPDGTVTLMFSDIEDSTVLTESLGDQAWQDLLRRHNALIRERIRAHDGFEVKTMGDGFMVAFQSAKKALECAIAMQRAFAEHNASDGQHVKIRIGLHAGEAIKEGGDFYGKNVIMASRVAGKAAGGEILVSSLLRSLVESSVDAALFVEAREVELKGLSGLHTVHRVRWEA
jgi:class 3 adenylate cyclase